MAYRIDNVAEVNVEQIAILPPIYRSEVDTMMNPIK
jgi:hypothetical protein